MQDQHEDDRKNKVKLFFYGERPCVQQRFQIRCRIEIARLPPEQKVRREKRDGGDTGSKALEVQRHEQEVRCEARDCDDRKERWKYPTDAPFVESNERELAVANLAGNERGDEISRNHEKYVHTNEAASK